MAGNTTMTAPNIVAIAQRVLGTEAAALDRLARDLPADFPAVVQKLLTTRGRVILSGIGKSGHIGRKIASTLASTGTPAYFVHPAEASHGDLGIIVPEDICLLISNSGETAELSDLIHHSQRFSIPLIGMSRVMDSTLMRAADLRLLVPDAPEACAIGMAPTTSTTMMMALGDALAVALMELRGFRREEFHGLHPGGKLGAQLALVHQLMHKVDDISIVTADTPMNEALFSMTEKGFGMTCVVEQDRLIGVISDGDLRRNIDHLMTSTAGQIATRNPKTTKPSLPAARALDMMNRSKIHSLVVVDEADRPIGLLRIHDCLRVGVV